MGAARCCSRNQKKGFFMDKLLIVLAGGSLVSLLFIIALGAWVNGFQFQGVLVGSLGAMFSAVLFAMFCDA